MRYGAGIVKWTKSELDEIGRKTRRVMTLNQELWKSKTRVASSNPQVTSSNPRVRRLKTQVTGLKARLEQ